MNTRIITTAIVALSVSLAACGGAESTAESEVSATASPAVTTEAESTADETTVTDTAAPASTAAPATTPATTDAPEAPATTSAPSSDESVDDELELVSVLAVSLGAGSGEYDILVDRSPDGLERFKVSTSGADGYCNAQILDTQSTADGVVITVLPDCGGTTFGVAWVHVDGRRSDIAYRDCSAGITYETDC